MMPKVTEPIHVVELSMDELQSILKHVKALGLPEKEHEALRALVESYAFLLDEIGDKKATIERLRQLVFGAKTETKANVRKRAGKSGTGAQEKPKKKRKGHGRIPAEAYTLGRLSKVDHHCLRELIHVKTGLVGGFVSPRRAPRRWDSRVGIPAGT